MMPPIHSSAANWQEIFETTSRAFENNAIEPRELNALYDAAKNGRLIESIFATGLYRYKTKTANLPDSWQSWLVDYMPPPVSANPLTALDEAGQRLIAITISYDEHGKLWDARCDLENGAYSGTATHSERDQAIARAIMSAVCLRLPKVEAGNG